MEEVMYDWKQPLDQAGVVEYQLGTEPVIPFLAVFKGDPLIPVLHGMKWSTTVGSHLGGQN